MCANLAWIIANVLLGLERQAVSLELYKGLLGLEETVEEE